MASQPGAQLLQAHRIPIRILHRNNGKENGNYHLGSRVILGLHRGNGKEVETTIYICIYAYYSSQRLLKNISLNKGESNRDHHGNYNGSKSTTTWNPKP